MKNGEIKRNILEIDLEILIDYSAQKMAPTYALDYSEFGCKKYWQEQTCKK